jgi:hypothetical protein
MRVYEIAITKMPFESLTGDVKIPAAVLRSLSWEKLDATECDVERDLKFILCEQDFTSLCGTQWPDDKPQNFPGPLTLQPPGDTSLPAIYFQGHDDDGNCVKVCVIRDTTAPH